MSDGFVCINCGAALSFEPEGAGTSLEKAACKYCGAINDRAQALLQKERADERRFEVAEQTRNRFVLQLAAAVLGATALLGGIAAHQTGTKLSALHAAVAEAKSQVMSVRERRAQVVARFEQTPDDAGRDAELSGADNRVRVEMRHYDEAAAAFNGAIDGPWARFCAKLTKLPDHAELSSGVTW
jgi:hypothetical protein